MHLYLCSVFFFFFACFFLGNSLQKLIKMFSMALTAKQDKKIIVEKVP